MALATIDDLVALGALGGDVNDGDHLHTRATRLLELASATVVQFVRADEATITDEEGGWPAESQAALAAVVAEVASRRLTAPAAASSDQIGLPPQPHMALRLWPSDEAALERIPEVASSRSSARPSSLGVTRSNSWLTQRYGAADS